MSVFCSSSPSTSGPILSKITPRQALSFLYPIESSRSIHGHARLHNSGRRCKQMVSSTSGLEAWFFTSLANAGHCRRHMPQPLQPSTLFTSPRGYCSTRLRQEYGISFQRYRHTINPRAESEIDGKDNYPPAENHTREELLELVDQYTGDSYTDQLPLLELPQLYQPSDGPNITVSDKAEDEWPPPNYTWPADAHTKIKLTALEEALNCVDGQYKGPEEVYRLYRDLPEPRAQYLESKTRHRMLRHLSVVDFEHRNEHSMLRYLSVVDDMKRAAIPLTTGEWTSAISFAARYVGKSSEVEAEAALNMWREMEHVAGVKGNGATFNVLFDVACKAGKFVLADMIYKEMEGRGYEFDRYHHVSKIFYHGMQRNGDGARAAYKALVEAGEVVDTVVLNAMISALIRSHEVSVAENVYERMKKAHLERSGAKVQPRDFHARRSITKILKKWALEAKLDKAKSEQFNRWSIIAPDLHTFQILVNHFAVQAGELDRTAKLLEEMKWFDLPLHGSLFLALLKGFSIHGGIRYTHWTEARLEGVWKSFLEALDNKSGLYISKWMITWALRAFAKCSGKSRASRAWEEIKTRWEPDEADLQFVLGNLRTIMEAPDAAEKRHDWLIGSM